MPSSDHLLACALVSTDPELQGTVSDLARGPGAVLRVAAVVDTPFGQVRDPQVQALRQADPELLIVDVEDDPLLGIRFLQFLTETFPGRPCIVAGPALSSEQLLAAVKAGMSDFVPKPAAEDELRAAVQRLRRRHGGTAAAAERAPGELLAVFSAKGGSGCTTVAASLAVQLHRLTGKKTLLLDL